MECGICADLPVNQFFLPENAGGGYRLPTLGLYPSSLGLDWPAMEDGGDVLGNLPRTRPGRRSEKRASRQAPAAKRHDRPAAPGRGEPDPVGDAIRAATGVAQASVKVANGITRELLRRIPRP